jgi:two-component system, LytTR family, response regulator
MTRIKTLIVEDERLAANALLRLLVEDPEIDVIGIARDGRTAVDQIERTSPDLVLLDIEIPELDGFGIIEAIGVDNMPMVIFVTAYDRYTLRAFEVHALDYLLKPFEPERLHSAMARAKRDLQLRREWQQGHLAPFLATVSRSGNRRVAIKSAGRIVFLEADEIDYVEAAGNYVRLHVNGVEYLTRDTMSSITEKLAEFDFVRIHRSVIVNRKRVKELRPWFTGEYIVILNSGKELTLSRGFRDNLHVLRACG